MSLRRRATIEREGSRALLSSSGACGSRVDKFSEFSNAARQGGYTLLEMVIVVALLAVIAAVAVPSVMPAQQHKLAAATAAVAEAFRFAREESRHTGVVHGVSVDLANNRIRVFRLDEAPNPNEKLFDVYQPVSKQLYAVETGMPPYGGVTLNALGGQMLGTCNDPGNFAFDAGGVVRCVEPLTTRIRDASVELAIGGLTLSVDIDDYTGRVSIQ
ncbi:MAG: prepilin-type N-terminal cleavage/methylation domain-containing protein [Woeseia sp.]